MRVIARASLGFPDIHGSRPNLLKATFDTKATSLTPYAFVVPSTFYGRKESVGGYSECSESLLVVRERREIQRPTQTMANELNFVAELKSKLAEAAWTLLICDNLGLGLSRA